MRLTEKNYCGYDVANRELESDYTDKEIFKVLQKLGQLEDIEEEIGVDLFVYLKMTLGTKVFVKDKTYEQIFENGIMEQKQITYSYSFDHKCFCVNIYGTKTPIYYIEDYGKKWALTKEELL